MIYYTAILVKPLKNEILQWPTAAILDFCQLQIFPTFFRGTPLQFPFKTFEKDKTNEKRTFALHSHGSSPNDPTIRSASRLGKKCPYFSLLWRLGLQRLVLGACRASPYVSGETCSKDLRGDIDAAVWVTRVSPHLGNFTLPSALSFAWFWHLTTISQMSPKWVPSQIS